MNSGMRAALTFFLLLGAVAGHSESEPVGYSAASLYNIANSYARAGKPGMAILNYERASLLSPGDPDVQFNLRLVRASAHLPAESTDLLDRTASIASPFWISWIGVLGLSLAGVSLIASQLSSWYRRARGVATLLGVSMLGLTLSSALALWPRLHQGVVIVAATPVRVSPVPMGDPLFSLAEGDKVKITAEHDGFALIETRTGRTGWISYSNLAPIVPR
ncbi:MAG: SH3 domain-containing protein [Steroidobacteraceae bacterium]